MFIGLTTGKGDPLLLNCSEIVCITVSKGVAVVYYGDMEYVTVKESFDEIKGMLSSVLRPVDPKI